MKHLEPLRTAVALLSQADRSRFEEMAYLLAPLTGEEVIEVVTALCATCLTYLEELSKATGIPKETFLSSSITYLAGPDES